MLLYGCYVKTVKLRFRADTKIGRTRLICIIIEKQFLRDKFGYLEAPHFISRFRKRSS